jgi:hypothetical protein
MIAVVPVLVQTVQHLAVPVVRSAAMPLQPMAVTSLLKPVELKPLNPPLSAYAQSPRQLQQLTAKENNHVATRSSQIPQRAEGP